MDVSRTSQQLNWSDPSVNIETQLQTTQPTCKWLGNSMHNSSALSFYINILFAYKFDTLYESKKLHQKYQRTFHLANVITIQKDVHILFKQRCLKRKKTRTIFICFPSPLNLTEQTVIWGILWLCPSWRIQVNFFLSHHIWKKRISTSEKRTKSVGGLLIYKLLRCFKRQGLYKSGIILVTASF